MSKSAGTNSLDAAVYTKRCKFSGNMDLMKIPYRLTSSAALGALALAMVVAFLPRGPRAAGWDPCSMVDDQFGTMPKLVTLVSLGVYVAFTIRGLCNRSGPRWLAIAGVLALFLSIKSDRWRISAGCYSSGSMAIFFLWAGIVSLMFLHHAVQPQTTFLVGRSPGSLSGSHPASLLRLAWRGVLPALAFMPIAWSALNMFRGFGWEPNLAQEAIATVQHCISWATFALFLIAAALLLCLLTIQLRSSMRT
jgi:hypothetical protein